MSTKSRMEDYATLLYLVPFILSGVYGLVLWIQGGISPILPSTVYLAVTRDPYVFSAGSLAVMLGLIVEVRSTEQNARPVKLSSLGGTLQTIAIASLVLVLVCAFYANGFLDVEGAATDFIVGRYGLVFPTLLVVLSYLITAQFRLAALGSRKILAIVALLLVPASLYEIGKREITIGLLLALVFLIVGVGAYVMPDRKRAPKQE
jgi:hypothetical protein